MTIIRASLGARDWKKIAEIAGDLHHAHSRSEMGAVLVASMRKLVDGNGFFFWAFDPVRRELIPYVHAPSLDPDFAERWPRMNALLLQHPCGRLIPRSPDGLPALDILDCTTRAEWERLPIYNECFRGLGMDSQLGILTPSKLGLVAFRPRYTFSDRDYAIMNMLRWHITAADARIQREALRRDAVRGLTLREHEVLREAARGLSNAQIGKALSISTGTVRRHFENIFEKLAVHNRVGALRAIAQSSPVDCEFLGH